MSAYAALLDHYRRVVPSRLSLHYDNLAELARQASMAVIAPIYEEQRGVYGPVVAP
ncbi:MAG: hypothetical protein ACYDGY_03805 [Acidimicrobiales bacterium]